MHNWNELAIVSRYCQLIIFAVLNYLMQDSSFNFGQWFFSGDSSNESSRDELFETIENASPPSVSYETYEKTNGERFRPSSITHDPYFLFGVLQWFSLLIDFLWFILLFCKCNGKLVFFAVLSFFYSLVSTSISSNAFVKYLFLDASFLFKFYSL